MYTIRYSIIIPAYNRKDTISDAVKSVLSQSFTGFELIVIDDGSTDNTKELILSYAADKQVHYYYQQNKGVSAARNYGASLAKGDYLVFLDSDDILHENFLSKFHESLQIHKASYLSCGYIKRDSKGSSKVFIEPIISPLYNNIKGNYLAGTFAISKDLFFKVGLYDTNLTYSENTELYIRVTNNQPTINSVFINEALVTIHYDRSSIKQNYYRPRIINSTTYILKKHNSLFKRDLNKLKSYLKILSYNCFKSKQYFKAFNYLIAYLKYRYLTNAA